MSQVSRPMLALLGVTLLLTVGSFGVRQWRESASMPSVIEGAVPARPAQDAPAADGETPNGMRSADLLRPVWPEASVNAMAGRQAPPPPGAAEAAAVPAVPPPPPLPDPTFRLVGAFADGKKQSVFFVQGEELIAARVGQVLPDGFVLKAVRGEKVTVVRKADGRVYDMILEAP